MGTHFEFKKISKVLPHIIFWGLLWVALIWLDRSQESILSTAITELIRISGYVVLIYINWYFLMPAYLNKEKFWMYALYLIGLVLMVTLVKIMILYVRYYYDPDTQYFLLQNQAWIFISGFLITGSSTVIKIISEWIKHQSEKRELERRSMQSELNFLKTQINPHFLFNTLNNLYALTLKKSDLAPQIVLKISEIMRYMLYECVEKYVPLSKELQYMQYYVDLEKLRFDDKSLITFEIEGNTENLMIAPLILLPFIENAFKHGLKSSASAGSFCHIKLQVQEDQLTFTVVNSKIQHIPELDNHGGIGLVNVQRRLSLLYPDQYKLRVKNGRDRFEIALVLKLDYKNKQVPLFPSNTLKSL